MDADKLKSIAMQYAEERQYNPADSSAIKRLERQLLEELREIGATLLFEEQVYAYRTTDKFAAEKAQLDRLLNRY
jgi:hypothetical protein